MTVAAADAPTRAEAARRTFTLTPWRFVLATWVVSRLFFMVVGAIGAGVLTDAWHANVYRQTIPGVLGYWATWDGAWYQDIAANGYSDPTATAFFPLYPLLVAIVNVPIGELALAGVAISLVSLLFALYFLYRVAEREWGERVARATTLAFAFFPTALFLNAVYTEALFLALATGAVWAARVRQDLLVAGFFAYFAALTRNVGVLLFLPLAHEWLRDRREHGALGLLGLAAAPCGLATYMVYLWKGLGDPFYFSFIQRQKWGRGLTDPLATLREVWRTARDAVPFALDLRTMLSGTESNAALIASNTVNLVFLALVVALLVGAAARLPAGLALYALAAVMIPVLTPVPGFPLMGFPRYVLAAFPLFFVLGLALARSRLLLATWLAASASVGAVLTLLFVSWRWVA